MSQRSQASRRKPAWRYGHLLLFLIAFCCFRGVYFLFLFFAICAGYATGARRVGWTASSSTLRFFPSHSTVCSFLTLFWDRQGVRGRGEGSACFVHDWWMRGSETGTLAWRC